MSGGIAYTLAAHQIRWLLDRAECRHEDCTRFYTGGRVGIERHHVAHQAEVLSSAGYGDLSALLDDLHRFARDWDEHAARFTAPQDKRTREDWEHLARIIRSLAARYAPSDPTPKEQS